MRRIFILLTFIIIAFLTQTTEARKLALLIGVDDYESVQSLRCCVNDMNTLKEALMKIGFEESDIQMLVTGGAFRNLPTKKKIEQKLSALLSSANSSDLVFIAFSGHGVQIGNKVYFCPPDADLEYLEGTCVSITKVMDDLAKCPAKSKWVIVDACRNDPSSSLDGKGLQAVPAPPEGIALFQSCAKGEKSCEEPNGKNGYFAKNFAAALSGKADSNNDGQLTLMEVCTWTTDHTKSEVKEAEKTAQSPCFSGSVSDFALTEDLNVSKATALAEEAQIAMDAENYELAIKKYDEAIELCPKIESWKREREYAQQALDLKRPSSNTTYSDALLESPLTWSVNSIQLSWTSDEDIPRIVRFLYGTDPDNKGTNPTNNTMFILIQNNDTNDPVEENVERLPNPLSLFGLAGSKVNASFYIEGEFDYAQNNSDNAIQWSEVEKTFIDRVLSAAFEQDCSDQRLIFTIDFINHSSSPLVFSSDSTNTLSVYCQNVQIGSATLIGDQTTIAATGKPVSFQFEMTLDEKGKQLLANSRPNICLESSQLNIHSLDEERIEDAIRESTSVSSYFTVAILSGNEVKEWKIRWIKNNPVTLQKALEAINEKVCKQNNDNTPVFDIKNGRIVSVCNVSFTENDNSDWTAELKLFKGTSFNTVSNPDSCLSETPGRGERCVFQLVSSEITQALNNGNEGNAEAVFELSKRYDTGDGVPEDKVRALEALQNAAESGFAEAQFYFGRCCFYGNGVPENKEEAVKWYRKAAQQDFAKGQNSLGYCYENGEGVSENHEEAISWYRKAAQQDNKRGQYNLGLCYHNGRSVPEDKTEAVKWFRKAADQEFALAQRALGLYYEHGWGGFPEDKTAAISWYRKAAEQDNPKAQFNLGICYNNGIGVPEDKAEALIWFRKAAQQELASAQRALGLFYERGWGGVPEDPAKAVKWYRKAAQQDHAKAQYNLGVCYYYGNGVPEDKAEAAKWLRKAAQQGDESAINALKKLNIPIE